MSYHSRMILTPGSGGPSRKRKEREDKQQQQQPFYYSSLKPSSAQVPRAEPIIFKPAPSSSSEPSPKPSSNRLLAGYMAHEFLTKGTLLGQKFDAARADAEPRRIGAEPVMKRPEDESYADVANLLKGDGAHVQGVVNPTQLARWIQM